MIIKNVNSYSGVGEWSLTCKTQKTVRGSGVGEW